MSGYYERIAEEKRAEYLRLESDKEYQKLAPIVKRIIQQEIREKLSVSLSINTSTESGDYSSYHSHTVRIQMSYDGEVISDTYEYFATD